MALFTKIVLATLPHVPRPVMRRVAARYFAGESLASAIAKLSGLAARGHPGIVDVLGEDVTSEQQARDVVREYALVADAVAAQGLDAYVSVKPTHLGLRISEELALEGYRELARHCRAKSQFVRVEMEDHTTTDATLRVFETLRKEFDNVGCVLQSRLFRTAADIAQLAPGPLSVRMVKGIYLEPPEIAHVEPEKIRAAYLECTRALLDRGAFVSFATHDEPLGAKLVELACARGLGSDAYEFQVLLGVQEALWERWRAAGHTVRVYVPFGPEWLPYSLRRLKKNPEILQHIVRATLRLAAS